jgi:biopolymer transport protein ExbD
MITRKEARSIIRKALKRVPEGEEIRHLNIMPMMDIMTILLVAFLYSLNEDAAFDPGSVQIPYSRSFDPKPEQAVTLIITPTGVVVQGQPVVDVKNGDVDSSEKKDGALGLQIPKISRFLGAVRAEFDNDMRAKGKEVPAVPELFIIADRTTPYRLLFQVIVSSRSDEAGYRRFRLIVLQGSED